MRLSAFLVAPLLCALLAGCSGSGGGDDDSLLEVPAGVPDGAYVADEAGVRDLRVDLRANDTLQAPMPWAVGDSFGVHVFFGDNDTEGFHYSTVVVGETEDSYLVATDDPYVAKQEVAFDLPILGPMAKADLSTTGLGGAWELLQFPLYDGATWDGQIVTDPFNPEALIAMEFQATYNPAIETPYGAKQGFDIVGYTGDAQRTLLFDYVPAIGWFTKFILYNTATEAPEDTAFSARSMGVGHGWTGTYYLDSGQLVSQHFSVVAPPDDAGNPTQYVAPQPYSSFTVGEEATHLYGFLYSFSYAGAHDVVLVDPAGGYQHYPTTGSGYSEAFIEVDTEAAAGQWHVATAGAGVATGGGVFLWEITETTGTL